jgi:ribosomal protein S18 acetylase RimI-like enzyme
MADGDSAHVRRTVVRAAEWRDADPLSRTLARAFSDDPLICFLLGEKTAMMPRLFRALFRLALPDGACDVTEGYEAAALWRPPLRWHTPIYRYIINGPQLQFPRVFGLGGIVRAVSALNYIGKRHPKEPHYYLQVVGTDPQQQGNGFGGVVMRRQLTIADSKGMPAYLESSKEKNIPIYQRFGFQVTGEIKLPEGPTLYPMWRPARARR